MSDSMIRDISLSDNGEQRIRWVAKFMPALNALREEFIKDQTFKGKTIVMSIHLEAKTAYLALTLKAAGANVIVAGSAVFGGDIAGNVKGFKKIFDEFENNYFAF